MTTSNLYVLTGGPCSGKSTLLDYFKIQGYGTLPETAREVISERMQNTLTREEIRTRQEIIFVRQLERESLLRDYDSFFLDRSLIDGIAYTKLGLGSSISLFESVDLRHRYKSVFLLDLFPFEKDSVRTEDNEEEARVAHEYIRMAYTDLGYTPIEVPVGSVQERAAFILCKMRCS